jgi:cytochrome c oxidase assembly protein subunit 15
VTAAADPSTRLRVLFARAAVAAAALTFIVVVASAFMRHTQVGLACADWPACYGRIDSGAAADATTGVRIVRVAHRIAATAVLALVLGLALIAWTQRPPWKKEGALATASLALVAGLAILGVATPGARLPAVTLGNLLGGFLLLALLAAAAAAARGERAGTHHDGAALAALALAVLALTLVQATLGGSIGAQYALTSCTTLARCPGFPFDEFRATAALDPFRPLTVVDGRVVAPADAGALVVIHRTLAIVVVVAALVLAWRLRAGSRRLAATLAVVAVAAAFAGLGALAFAPSLALTVVHNACSALLVATLAVAVGRAAAPAAT